uniref:Uncharacterized protein n=1 Tax=Triticum urartu TaxID=4572 RepID=A0A8R7TJ60_TRIUA
MGLLSDELYEVIHHLTKNTNSSSSRNYSGSTVLKQRTVYTVEVFMSCIALRMQRNFIHSLPRRTAEEITVIHPMRYVPSPSKLLTM